jgi:hypothetical protein
LAYWAGQLGQDLFYPPNVGGWPGGRTWINAQTLIGRAKYAAALVGGALSRSGTAFDAGALVRRHGRGGDLDAILTFYSELLLGSPPSSAWRDRIGDALGLKATAEPEILRRAVALMLASPEAQIL